MCSEKQIEAILPGPIGKIVADIPPDGIREILKTASHCSLASSCIVRLQRSGPRIKLRYDIRIIGPHISEYVFERLIAAGRLPRLQNSEIGQHPIQRPASKHALDNVCSV